MAAQGCAPADVSERLGALRQQFARATERPVFAVYASGSFVGYAAAMLHDSGGDDDRYGAIVDVWISPAYRRHGYARATVSEVEQWLRKQGADRALVTLDPKDPAQLALFRHGTVNSQRMALWLQHAEPPALPPDLSWRPMTAAEYPAWLAAEIDGFAQQTAESGTLSAAAARERADRAFAERLPSGLETPDHSFTVLQHTGDVVAWLWLRHHFRHEQSFVCSVTVRADQRGRGYGRVIMRLGEQLAASTGDRVLGLNVFGHNTAAIRLYTSLGYEVTDQSRTIML